jgi:hypothetical protein
MILTTPSQTIVSEAGVGVRQLEYLEIFSRLPGKSKFLRKARAKRIFPNIDKVSMMKASEKSRYSIEPQTQDSDSLTEK